MSHRGFHDIEVFFVVFFYFNFFPNYFLIGEKLLYNVVLVSAAKQHE